MKKDIYIITNDINNKVYIGQAKNTKQRFQSHCKPSAAYVDNELIAKAIQKYGREHFQCQILEKQIENYNEKEREYIVKYNSKAPNGYNILDGGNEPPIYQGIQHPEAKLTQKQLDSLINDLKNTKLPYQFLAEKYNVTKTCIYQVNNGISYIQNINYPIRKNPNTLKKLNDTQVLEIINILKHTYRSYENIAKQYNIEYRIIAHINKGLVYRQEKEIYPIRQGQVGKNSILSYEKVSEIISLLLDTTLSLREIGRLNNCSYDTVLGIKNGTTKLYRRRELQYPLRKHNKVK